MARGSKRSRRRGSSGRTGRGRSGSSIRSDHGRVGMTFAEWVRKWRIGPGMNDAHAVTQDRIRTRRFLGHHDAASDTEALLAEGLYSGSDGRVGRGWIPLLDRLARDLVRLGWDRDLHQVKEKFGSLRFYVGESTEEMDELIREAGDLSERICSRCGRAKPVTTAVPATCWRCGRDHEDSRWRFAGVR